jgi:hypothetical protein
LVEGEHLRSPPRGPISDAFRPDLSSMTAMVRGSPESRRNFRRTGPMPRFFWPLRPVDVSPTWTWTVGTVAAPAGAARTATARSTAPRVVRDLIVTPFEWFALHPKRAGRAEVTRGPPPRFAHLGVGHPD